MLVLGAWRRAHGGSKGARAATATSCTSPCGLLMWRHNDRRCQSVLLIRCIVLRIGIRRQLHHSRARGTRTCKCERYKTLRAPSRPFDCFPCTGTLDHQQGSTREEAGRRSGAPECGMFERKRLTMNVAIVCERQRTFRVPGSEESQSSGTRGCRSDARTWPTAVARSGNSPILAAAGPHYAGSMVNPSPPSPQRRWRGDVPWCRSRAASTRPAPAAAQPQSGTPSSRASDTSLPRAASLLPLCPEIPVRAVAPWWWGQFHSARQVDQALTCVFEVAGRACTVWIACVAVMRLGGRHHPREGSRGAFRKSAACGSAAGLRGAALGAGSREAWRATNAYST